METDTIRKSRRGIGTTSRSAIIGIAATGIDLLALAVAVSLCGISPLVANVPALVLGMAVQFVGNKYWAFRDPSPRLARQLGLFSLVEVGALGLNAALFHGLVAGVAMPPLLARPIVSAAVYFGFSYLLWRRIFVSHPAQPIHL